MQNLAIVALLVFAQAWAGAAESMTYLPTGSREPPTHSPAISAFVSEHGESASFVERLKKGITLPPKFFISEPVVAVLGIYLVLLHILLSTFLPGFDYIFKKTYNLPAAQTASCFGAIAAGATVFAPFALPAQLGAVENRACHGRVRVARVTSLAGDRRRATPPCLVVLARMGTATSPFGAGWGAPFLFGAVLIAIYVSSFNTSLTATATILLSRCRALRCSGI